MICDFIPVVNNINLKSNVRATFAQIALHIDNSAKILLQMWCFRG